LYHHWNLLWHPHLLPTFFVFFSFIVCIFVGYSSSSNFHLPCNSLLAMLDIIIIFLSDVCCSSTSIAFVIWLSISFTFVCHNWKPKSILAQQLSIINFLAQQWQQLSLWFVAMCIIVFLFIIIYNFSLGCNHNNKKCNKYNKCVIFSCFKEII
jgi:hypothetical protein